MAANGYTVLPVNPHADRILGKKARASLDEVDQPVDLVLLFRPSGEAGGVVEKAASRPERPVIWLQEGIRADAEAAPARAEGLHVIQDLCIFKVHRAVHRW
jgi:predicted CoA-binding protein